MFKKITAIILVLALTLSLGTTAFAAEVPANTQGNVYSYDAQISEAGMDFVNKVVSVSKYWYLDKNNKLAINLTKDQLKNTYGFSDEQYDKMMAEVVGFSVSDGNTMRTQAYISNGALYISYNDLLAGAFAALVTAADIGPVALEAALVALSSAMGGPVGTVISLILTVVAAPSLVELGGRVLWAVSHGQGIYIKPVLSYPPLEIGYW